MAQRNTKELEGTEGNYVVQMNIMENIVMLYNNRKKDCW